MRALSLLTYLIALFAARTLVACDKKLAKPREAR
jgi:hypothetical protein